MDMKDKFTGEKDQAMTEIKLTILIAWQTLLLLDQELRSEGTGNKN